MSGRSFDEARALLYAECRFLSGGFQCNPLFAEVTAFGWGAVPQLLSDVTSRDDWNIHPWVASQLLHVIAGDRGPDLANPDDRGKWDKVVEMWLTWARENGITLTSHERR